MQGFEQWWYQEGSALKRLPTEDVSEFAYRIAGIAWSNGSYKENEACAELCQRMARRINSFDIRVDSLQMAAQNILARKV